MNSSIKRRFSKRHIRPSAWLIGLCLMGLAWSGPGVPAQVPSTAPPGEFPLPIVVRQIPKPIALPEAVPKAATGATLATHAADLNVEQGMRIGAYGQRGSSDETLAIGTTRSATSSAGVTKVVASLAVVLGLLFGFIGISRRFGGTVRSSGLPDEVVQVLGQFSLGGRQRACVVRFGSKLLALSVTPTGIEPLGELDDPDEVEGLTQLCLSRDMAVVPERLRAAVDRYASARSSRT